jgi:hypothetical protein
MIFGYYTSFLSLDKGVIELLGPTGVSYKVFLYARVSSLIQSGVLYHYTFFLGVGFSFFLMLLSYMSFSNINDFSTLLFISYGFFQSRNVIL